MAKYVAQQGDIDTPKKWEYVMEACGIGYGHCTRWFGLEHSPSWGVVRTYDAPNEYGRFGGYHMKLTYLGRGKGVSYWEALKLTTKSPFHAFISAR